MIQNKHKVQKSQWKKWNSKERELFNCLYEVSIANPWIFQHPKTKEIPDKYWNTVSWNHAWMAADLVREQRLQNA